LEQKPIKDKFKDMDFTEAKTSYENLRNVKNRLKMMPADMNLKDASDLDFDQLKQDFTKMKETSDRLKTVKTTVELPESLEDVDFHEVKQEFTDMKDLANSL
jgi:hypothetical protein